MAERIRWELAHAGSCDMQCDHASCQAWQRAGDGYCLLCARSLFAAAAGVPHMPFFAYRSNGTGASHIDCRLNQLASRQPIPRFTSENGEFQIGMPQSEDEVHDLLAWAAAARRFLAAIDSTLGACDAAAVVPLGSRQPGAAAATDGSPEMPPGLTTRIVKQNNRAGRHRTGGAS